MLLNEMCNKMFQNKKKPKPRVISDLIDQRPIPILPYNYYFSSNHKFVVVVVFFNYYYFQ